jgi:hypothetical protein
LRGGGFRRHQQARQRAAACEADMAASMVRPPSLSCTTVAGAASGARGRNERTLGEGRAGMIGP